MAIDKETLNPKDYPEHRDDDDDQEVDRGDDGIEEDEEEEDKPEKKPAEKKSKDKPNEEEDGEEEDEEDEEDDEEEDEKPAKGTTVPLHVLRKAQDKRRQAEARAADLERRLNEQNDTKSERQKTEFEKLTKRMDELYEQVEEARAEGKSAVAAKLQRELDGIREKMSTGQAAMLATKRALEAQNLVAYNSLVAELEVIDPRFDQDDDSYDEDLVERVGELTEAYEARGLSSPDALRKATRLILGKDVFRESRNLARPEKKEEKKVESRKTDTKKNLEAKRKQPPEDREKVKERPGHIDPRKISEEDFDKLPESKKRELRGDFG